MAVLVEGTSVVIRRKAIDSKFAGGWPQFVAALMKVSLPERRLSEEAAPGRLPEVTNGWFADARRDEVGPSVSSTSPGSESGRSTFFLVAVIGAAGVNDPDLEGAAEAST